MTASQSNRFQLLILLALVAYFIPWVTNRATGLTLGAYDLAEWLSLHPATHPDRVPSLLLRGQLLLLTLSIALSVTRPLFTPKWWIKFIIVLMLVVAQLPPPEFLAWTGDQNQRQQAILAITSLIAGIIALTGIVYPIRNYLQILISVIALISIIFVLGGITPLMQDFGLHPHIGIGGFMLIFAHCLITLQAINMLRNKNRAT